MEILASLESKLGFTTAEADYATLSRADPTTLADHVRRRLSAADAAEGPDRFPSGRVALAVPVQRIASADPPPVGLTVTPGADPRRAVADLVHGIADLPERPTVLVDPGDPAGRAVVAWLRSYARETGSDPVVVHPAGVATPGAVPFDPAPDAVALPTAMVCLASGGAGIVVPCLLALADLAPRVVLFGRRSPPAMARALADLRDGGSRRSTTSPM